MKSSVSYRKFTITSNGLGHTIRDIYKFHPRSFFNKVLQEFRGEEFLDEPSPKKSFSITELLHNNASRIDLRTLPPNFRLASPVELALYELSWINNYGRGEFDLSHSMGAEVDQPIWLSWSSARTKKGEYVVVGTIDGKIMIESCDLSLDETEPFYAQQDAIIGLRLVSI